MNALKFVGFLIVLTLALGVLFEYFLWPAIDFQMDQNSRQAINLQTY